mmetsp:Transcript_13017/g.40083  ORF Transcript_13017/g.40083 Transcript_13017/m.40083 type:complete len:327 (-) Transcript_13017:154-1134(-)
MMRAVIACSSKLCMTSIPVPRPMPNEVLIRVVSAGVNRADILQKLGRYPPPSGTTDVLGLECAGQIEAVGNDASKGFKKGDRVMALLKGGGYAEFVTADERCVARVPDCMSLKDAGGVPEAWATAYQLLHWAGHAQKLQYVLIHAAASGVGLAAVQIAHAGIGCEVIGTAGSQKKLEIARKYGASVHINYKETPEFSTMIPGRKVDLILDCVGASHWRENLRSICEDGTWVLYGTLGGTKVPEANLGVLLQKRICLQATTLRSRCAHYQGKLLEDVERHVLPRLSDGTYYNVIHSFFPLDAAEQAHKVVEDNENIGKVILTVSEEQ